RRERFGTGALVAGWLVLAALNLANPDAVIAGVNLARAADGRPLDVAYAAQLSADALPTFRRVLPTLRSNEACETAWRLDHRWQESFRQRVQPSPQRHQIETRMPAVHHGVESARPAEVFARGKHGAAECRASEVGAGHRGARQERPRQLGMTEIGLGQTGTVQHRH